MDLNLIAIAQSCAVNQLSFDQKAFGHSLQRAEKKRQERRELFTHYALRLNAIAEQVRLFAQMALAQRTG